MTPLMATDSNIAMKQMIRAPVCSDSKESRPARRSVGRIEVLDCHGGDYMSSMLNRLSYVRIVGDEGSCITWTSVEMLSS